MYKKIGKKNPLICTIYLLIACFFYVVTGSGVFFKNKAIILCYHGVTAMQRRKFEQQMNHLKQLIIKRKKDSLKVIVTFDDGFFNLLDNALPVLNALDIPAKIFVVPGNYGKYPEWQMSKNHTDVKERLMTGGEILSVISGGVTIGSHTQTHSKLTNLTDAEIDWEFIESKKNIEHLTGEAVEDIALPFGDFNHDVINSARKAGYKKIYTLEPKLSDYKKDFNVMGRFSVSPDTGLFEYHLVCSGAFFWLSSFRKRVSKLMGHCREVENVKLV